MDFSYTIWNCQEVLNLSFTAPYNLHQGISCIGHVTWQPSDMISNHLRTSA